MNLSISEVLTVLAKQRSIFHSEADFQHAIAWEIHKHLPRVLVRLERPVEISHLNKRIYVDIWIEQDGDVLAIELKYKTRALQVLVGSEQYSLRSQSAQDLGRYDFIKDIKRVENIVVDRKPQASGYAILLTNDSSYWKQSLNENTADANSDSTKGAPFTAAWSGDPAHLPVQRVGERNCTSLKDPTPCGGRTIHARPRAVTVGFATSLWRSRVEQKRIGWEMWVSMEKVICTVVDEAHKQQIEEAIDALGEGPKNFYE